MLNSTGESNPIHRVKRSFSATDLTQFMRDKISVEAISFKKELPKPESKPAEGEAQIDDLIERMSALSLKVTEQNEQIIALQDSQQKLIKESLKAGVSDGMVAEFQRFIDSLDSTALVNLACHPDVVSRLEKINLSKPQTENDVLISQLISALKDVRLELNKNGYLVQKLSNATDVAATIALKFYAPAFASMAVEAAFDSGLAQVLPASVHEMYQGSSVFQFGVAKPLKHQAMNYAFNAVNNHGLLTYGACYGLAAGLKKCASFCKNGVVNAYNSSYLKYTGIENNSLISLLNAMKSLQKQNHLESNDGMVFMLKPVAEQRTLDKAVDVDSALTIDSARKKTLT